MISNTTLTEPGGALLVEVSPLPSLAAALRLANRLGKEPGTRRAMVREYHHGYAVMRIEGPSGAALIEIVRRLAGDPSIELLILRDPLPADALGADASPAPPRRLLPPNTIAVAEMEEELQTALRRILAEQHFGVLATVDQDDELHTSTVLFAVTPAWEIVIAARGQSRKALNIEHGSRAAFQVDTRATAATDRQQFTRIGLSGDIRRVAKSDLTHAMCYRLYLDKLPLGRFLFDDRDVRLYLLEPRTMRVALGGRAPITVTFTPAT